MAPRPFRKDPISISYSGWKRYKECAQKHYLVMTGQRPDKVDERNFLNGQVLHKVLERWFENDEPSSWIAGQAEPVWHEYVSKKYILFKNAGDRAELLQKCITWGQQLVELVERLQLDKSKCHTELSVERFIEVDGHRVRLHGYIDVLAPSAGNLDTVIDLKCSTSRSVMDPYQLVYYSLLLGDGPGQDRYGAFLLPALDDIVPHLISEEHRQWLLAQLIQMARDIIADKFDPDPENANCFWCEVKAACPVMGGLPATRGRITL